MNQPPTTESLRLEAHRLIDVVARRPGAVKLLEGVLVQLRLFAAYKANRSYRRD